MSFFRVFVATVVLLGVVGVGLVSSAEARHGRQAGKGGGNDQGALLGNLQKAVDTCLQVAIDLKRYDNKDPDAHRHREKQKRVEKRLKDCLQEVDRIFRQVRNLAEARQIVSALTSLRMPVIPLLIINPCSDFIRKFLPSLTTCGPITL